MPNTLCHIAIQGTLCRRGLPPSSFVWILLGCILPDIPWVELHLLQPLNIDAYQLRFYCTAQASLFFCALLCGMIAMFVRRSKTVFCILLVNCLLHLLLDSLQIKWGNGVNLIAPFDWRLFSVALLWTDTISTRIVTIAGFFYLLISWKKASQAVHQHYQLEIPQRKKRLIALLCLIGWFTGPLLFFSAMERADTYFLHTLRTIEERKGKLIAFDRVNYNAKRQEITTFTGERLQIVGKKPKVSARASFKGRFINSHTIKSTAFHLHSSFRDYASKMGLLLTCLFVCNSLLLPRLFSRIHSYSKHK